MWKTGCCEKAGRIVRRDGMEKLRFRVARPEDAEELLKIYAPYVTETAITFEYEVPSVEAFRTRITNTLKTYPYIVAVMEDHIVGYAYVGRLHARAAYDWSVETSIYVDRTVRKMGLGRKLYERLEALLRAMHIINVNACIAYPCAVGTGTKEQKIAMLAAQVPDLGEQASGSGTQMPKTTVKDPHLDTNSPDFHAHLGYQLVGRFHACAYKFDRWYDMIWMEKWIAPHPAKPEPMTPFPKLSENVVQEILA